MSNVRFWAVIPAAGSGRRMSGAPKPKQYLPLAGHTVIEWALRPLLAHPGCSAVMVVLGSADDHWPQLAVAADPRIATVIGGAQRCDSVRAGLTALATLGNRLGNPCSEGDWVLVHDAARPCLLASDLQRLLSSVQDDAVGGLLAAPLVDTLKRAAGSQRVAHTISREQLWRAQTPQMFRFGLLQRALEQAALAGVAVTDESQALELLGLQPLLVSGDADNIKITLAEDLQRAEHILSRREGRT
jgi:2-C-methyl-D-erythritol 4-phosphate cytidylyltransferase